MPRKAWLYFLPYLIYKYLEDGSEKFKQERFREKYDLHPTFRFNGNRIQLYGEGRIHIGKDTYIGQNSSVQSEPSYEVWIGNGCAISHNVRIYTKTYNSDQDFSTDRTRCSASVHIGNNVWIGANVLINPGICIGDNSVVGANSVVTHDVPPGSIVGGVPARLIRLKKTTNC